MSDLLTLCSRCGKDGKASLSDKQGLCSFCQLDDEIKPLLNDYARLWGKHKRYAKAGVGLFNCEKQMTGVARRIGDRIHARIADSKVAVDLINLALEKARSHAERGRSRVLRPALHRDAPEMTWNHALEPLQAKARP
jgi:hypothetical protein